MQAIANLPVNWSAPQEEVVVQLDKLNLQLSDDLIKLEDLFQQQLSLLKWHLFHFYVENREDFGLDIWLKSI